MPVQTRSMRRRELEQERTRRSSRLPSSSLNPLSISFVPSQRPGQDTQAYHTERAREAREVASRFGIGRREDTRTLRSSDSVDINAISEILDENVSTLYSRLLNNNDIYNILNQSELLYLRNDTILSNYYQRRLEFNYTIDIVDKFNSLINMINIDKDNITDDNRYDINYYYEINNIITDIINDYKIIDNKTLSTQNNIRDLQLKISNEKVILNNLIRKLYINIESINEIPDNVVSDSQLERKIIYEQFKLILEERLNKLNQIRENHLRILIHYGMEYEDYRNYLKDVIKSAIILSSTLKKLIINIGMLRNSTDTHLKDLIIDDMMTAVEYYMNTINIRNDSERYRVALDLQSAIYYDIDTVIESFDFRNYIRDANEYIRNMAIDSNFIIRQREAAQERLQREIVYISNSQELERRREIIRQEREQQREARRQAREARRLAIIQARASGLPRPSRPSRTSRPSRPSRPSRSSAIIDIKFDNNDFEKNSSVESGFLTTVSEIDNEDYNKFLDNIKEILLKNRIKVKDSSEVKVKDNYRKLLIKYAKLFNKDEPNVNARTIPTIKNYVGNSIISLFVRYMKFDGDMKFNDSSSYYVSNITLIKDDNGVIREYKQNGIDAGGVRRDFITALLTELFEKKIFINRDGTDFYFLNPEFELDDFMKYIIEKKLTGHIRIDDDYFKEGFINDFYKFLGQLLTFILVNDCGLDKKLSSYIISSFLNPSNNYSDDDYVSLMINDFPQDFSTIINLMRDIDNIDFRPSFNDYYLLDETDEYGEEIVKDNAIDYLRKTAKFMMTTSILRKDIEISHGKDYKEIFKRGKKMNSLLIEGIPMALKEEFKNNNFNLTIINSYIKTPDMTDEIISNLISNFRSTMITMHNYRSNVKLQKLTELFVEFVLKNNKGKHTNNKVYFDFIIKLLKFWSGSSLFKERERYKIQLNENLSERHLPQSHTCFFCIDLPNYTGTDNEIGEKLFNKIEMAISNVESGIGLAGGARRKLRSKK